MIEYDIRHGRSFGPYVDISPGYNSPIDSEYIHINEDAFFVIESFFPDKKIDHYGPSTLSASDWSQAMQRISVEAKIRLIEAHRESFSLDQIDQWPWLARHPQIINDVRLQGMPGLLNLLEMLVAFSKIGARWSDSYPAVYISGV